MSNEWKKSYNELVDHLNSIVPAGDDGKIPTSTTALSPGGMKMSMHALDPGTLNCNSSPESVKDNASTLRSGRREEQLFIDGAWSA